jgi:hypothetical protein
LIYFVIPQPAAILGFAGLAAFVHNNDEKRLILKGTCLTLWYCQVTAFNGLEVGI